MARFICLPARLARCLPIGVEPVNGLDGDVDSNVFDTDSWVLPVRLSALRIDPAATSAPVTPSFAPGGTHTSVAVGATAQCSAGKASLTVRVTNRESVKVDVRVSTTLGSQKVTNLAAGISDQPLSHAEVLEAGQAAAERCGRLLADVVGRL